MQEMSIKAATLVAGSLGFPSKMPGTSYGISAHHCKIGSKLAAVPGSTCHGCYALKANYIYPSVAKAHAKRLAGIVKPEWPIAMATLLLARHGMAKGRKRHRRIKRKGKGWHRWHDSGDLQSREHLAKICVVCALTPRIRHWLPTRELAIVLDYVSRGGIVPPNLMIRVSATMVDGQPTSRWQWTSGVHFEHAPIGQACPAPLQGNECKDCRACWSFDVPTISYHKH
jgi:hypothetical protein